MRKLRPEPDQETNDGALLRPNARTTVARTARGLVLPTRRTTPWFCGPRPGEPAQAGADGVPHALGLSEPPGTIGWWPLTCPHSWLAG